MIKHKTRQNTEIYPGSWKGKCYELSLTEWDYLTDIRRAYFEHRIRKGNNFKEKCIHFQKALDDKKQPAFNEMHKFLFKKQDYLTIC